MLICWVMAWAVPLFFLATVPARRVAPDGKAHYYTWWSYWFSARRSGRLSRIPSLLPWLVSILIGFFIPATLNKWLLTAIKLAIMPLVMGIGYELIKLCGKHDNVLTRIIAAPGVWLQHLTVFEPTDDMIECAIEALKRVIPEETGKDEW